MYREQAPCPLNSSHSFWPILLKLYRCFKDGLKICMWFFQNPEIIFYHFLHVLNLDIFWVLILQKSIGSRYLVPLQGGHALRKTGKMVKKIPCREKVREFEILLKIKGISKNLIFVRSKYSNFIAVQMWLLVVSFCHMLKIPADLILLKGGVLVRWSTCFLYILFFLFLIPKWTFYCKPNDCH